MGKKVTHFQIALFGLSGGLLMPCPAAFTIVLVCLQLKQFTLGIVMVLSFSAGLAFTLVATGALAAGDCATPKSASLGLVKSPGSSPIFPAVFWLLWLSTLGFKVGLTFTLKYPL